MHASPQVLPTDDYDDIGKVLLLWLIQAEWPHKTARYKAKSGISSSHASIPINDDIMVLAWSDLATSIEHEGSKQAAVTWSAELGVEQSALRDAMACKVVNEASIVAIRRLRRC